MGESDLNIIYPTHFTECENCIAVNPLIDRLRYLMTQKQLGLPVINQSIQIKCKMGTPNNSTFSASGKMYAMDELTRLNETVESTKDVECPGYLSVINEEQTVKLE